MKAEELKTGLWGFKKFSVYQYITSLEESFSSKLLEKDEENRAALVREQQRAQELEAELGALRQRYEALKNEQALIANTLLDAQRYAASLKTQAEEQARAAQERLNADVEQKLRELGVYEGRLQQLRGLLKESLCEMDNTAGNLAEKVGQIQQNLEEGNMSLFCRETKEKEE